MIHGVHIPSAEVPMERVTVQQRDVRSYYRYVNGGPVDYAYLNLIGVEVVAYVNSRYMGFEPERMNWRASALFELAGVGMAGGAIRGDVVLVQSPGSSDYDRSLPEQFIAHLLKSDADSA